MAGTLVCFEVVDLLTNIAYKWLFKSVCNGPKPVSKADGCKQRKFRLSKTK